MHHMLLQYTELALCPLPSPCIRVNQTVILYNYWYNQKNQGRVFEPLTFYWIVRSLLSVGRMDMAVDVFRSHPRFEVLPNRAVLSVLIQEAMDRELYELSAEVKPIFWNDQSPRFGHHTFLAVCAHHPVTYLQSLGCLDSCWRPWTLAGSASTPPWFTASRASSWTCRTSTTPTGT